jgi:protein O-mannosyl-transferase
MSGERGLPKESRRRQQRPEREDPDRRRHDAAAENRPVGQAVGANARRNAWIAATVLVAAVFLAYQPAWHGGFLWDDDTHLLNNPVLKAGGLLRTWIPGTFVNYWPVTSTVYWIEYQFWGFNPLGFHLVSIALHALAALLVWRVLAELRMPGALFAAAVFALHPVNVESVAWITQLKNTLSLPLAVLSTLFYLLYKRKEGLWRLAASLALFVLSALAKGLTLTLPVVLLASDWWQQGRVGRRDLLRVFPYVIVATFMVGVEVAMQHIAAAHHVVRVDSFASRAATAGCAVWFYFWKVVWPANLVFIYPRWGINERDVLSYVPGVLLVLIAALAWWRRRSWGRPVTMFIVCYVGLLLPVLGFVDIYFMRYSLVADHWQYAAMIVPCAALAGAIATSGRRWPWLRSGGYVFSVGVLIVLTAMTFRQSRMYSDIDNLYRTTLDRNPDCWLAHSNLGNVLFGRGQIDAALAHYQKALAIKPDYPEAHYNLGLLLESRGEGDAALAQYKRALEIKPDYAAAHNNLGILLESRGDIGAALVHYRRALEIDPDNAGAHNNLGNTLFARGQADAAIVEYERALQIKPDYAECHNNLGAALAGRGQADAARAHFEKAVELKPDYAEAHNNLGILLAGRGETDAARAQFEKAVKLEPDYTEAHNNLALLFAGRGETDAAVAHFQKVVELKPDDAGAHYRLGVALASRGEIEAAIVQFRKALEIKPDDQEARGSLDLLVAHGK